MVSVITGLRRNAIEGLADFRAVNAHNFVVREMTLKLPPDFLSERSPYEDYPAAQAILDVGEPAIQTMLSAGLGRPPADDELKLIAYILWHYYAPQNEQDVGLYRLQRLLERTERQRAQSSNRTGRARAPSMRETNLHALIETYKSIQPGNFKDWPKP